MRDQWSPEQVARVGEQVTRWAADYYGGLEERPIAPEITPAESDALFDEPIPRRGLGFDAAFAEVREKVVPHALGIPHPRYFGLMNPTPVTPAIFTEVVVSALNQNMGAWSHSPTGTAVEKRVVRWLCDLVGYPAAAAGTFCSGGSVANLIALRTAMAHMLPESLERGLQALPEPPVFYVSAEAHFSFKKAAMTLGLGTAGLRPAATDARARIDVAALRAQLRADRAAGLRPFALVATAGTTSSGSIDPVVPLAELAAEEGLWYHVDAAWGSGALVSERHRGLLAGLERADSITFDPHKWFFLPIAAGAVLTRDGEALPRTFATDAVYIPTDDDERTDFRRWGLVGSKRMDALKLWVSLKALGVEWYEEVVDRHMELTEWLVARLEEDADWEVVVRPDLNILCFRYRPAGVAEEELPALQDRVVDAVVRDGRSWISPTVVNGVRAIRWMALSPALTAEDMVVFWESMRELAAGVVAAEAR
ncbi:MAG TPA: aspartate aminotransferase family protein [Longimicrobiaceae bacterium]|nr:aspartate aminotransferase family protein [Longimicrobiaceae bacterium]